MVTWNKNWIAAGFLGIGTFFMGISVVLTGIFVGQQNPAAMPIVKTQAADLPSRVTNTIFQSAPTPQDSPIAQNISNPPCLLSFFVPSTSLNQFTSSQSQTPSFGSMAGSPTPIPTFQCLTLKMYTVVNSHWTPMKDASGIKPGDIVTLAVIGATTSGIIDSARFSINGGAWITTTAVNQFGEFYYQYTFPLTPQSYTIHAQVHHITLGWL